MVSLLEWDRRQGQRTIQDENVKYSELNEGEISTDQNLWNAAYAMFEAFISWNIPSEKEKSWKLIR